MAAAFVHKMREVRKAGDKTNVVIRRKKNYHHHVDPFIIYTDN